LNDSQGIHNNGRFNTDLDKVIHQQGDIRKNGRINPLMNVLCFGSIVTPGAEIGIVNMSNAIRANIEILAMEIKYFDD